MVIPVHDVNPVRRTPWVTYLLIALNILVFLFTPAAMTTGLGGGQAADLCEMRAFYEEYGAVPRELVENRPLARVGTGDVETGKQGPYCETGRPTFDKVPVLSVLSSMFLHGGWLHLLGNMLFLYVFGNNVEERFGRLKFLLFYLFTGYVAAYGFALANANSGQPLVGASGAVSGVLGAYLILFPRARVWSLVPFLLFIPLRLPAWLVLGIWFALQWFYSVGYAVSGGGSVAYLAHVLGFLVGLAGALLLRKRRPPAPPAPYWPPPPYERRYRNRRPAVWREGY